MFGAIKKLFAKKPSKNVGDENAALLRHVQGATVVHAGPFANLDVPILPSEKVRHLYPEYVVPFYMKRLQSFDANTDAAFSKVRARITDGIITSLLSDFNWRSRTAAAYFTLILDRPTHIDHIGRLFLRSDVCYAGGTYCRVMAHSNSDIAVDYLNRYLSYYLTRPELYFDQADALSALRFIDQKRGTEFEAEHASAIAKMVLARPDFLEFVSVDLITADLNAVKRIQNL